MEKLFSWLKSRKNWKWLILGTFATLFAPLIIVHLLFKIPYINDFFTSAWSAGEILGYIGSFYALVGTAIFSCLTLWQNNRFKKENEKSQDRLMQISNQKIIPIIEISLGKEYHNGENKSQIELCFNNIGQYAIKNISVHDLSLEYDEKPYEIDDYYFGGLASNKNSSKLFDIKNVNIMFLKQHSIKMFLTLSYYDILDKPYNKKCTIVFGFTDDGKFQISKITIGDSESIQNGLS